MKICRFMAMLVLCFLGNNAWGAEKLDPFSKITVKSERACFKKMPQDNSSFSLQYKDNVHVCFADSTTVSADQLEVIVQDKTAVERVIFKNNVVVRREHRNVYADNVEIRVHEKLCTLSGHVRVEQLKNGQGELPMCTMCEKARVHWGSDKIELVGCDETPVCTTIELGGKLRLFHKKRSEKTS